MRFHLRRLALLAVLLCWIPDPVQAQECVAGPVGFDQPSLIVLVWGQNTVIPPWGGTAEITLELRPVLQNPRGCDAFRVIPEFGAGGEWIHTIDQWIDSTPSVQTLHLRIRFQGNLSGVRRTATITVPFVVQGNENTTLVYLVTQDASRCSAVDGFNPQFFFFGADGLPLSAPIQIQVSNQDPAPCNVRLTPKYPLDFIGPLPRDEVFGVQVSARSTDLSGGNAILFPNGFGQVAAGEGRNLSIFPTATPNPTCTTRVTRLFIELNGVRQPFDAVLSQERSAVPTGSPGLCVPKVKAAISGKPEQHKPNNVTIGMGVRG